MKCVVTWLAVVLCAASWNAKADPMQHLSPEVEYEKRLQSAQAMGALKSDLFGESVSLYNGSTEFVLTDVHLPGNSALPVRVGRRLKIEAKKEVVPLGGFGSWDIDVPYLYGTFPSPGGWDTNVYGSEGRCSGRWLPPIATTHYLRDIWAGNFLHMPGEGDSEILRLTGTDNQVPTDGQSYPRGTKNGIRFKCLADGMLNYPGELFTAVDSNGVTYEFGYAINRGAGGMKGTPQRPAMFRTRVFFMVTHVEDRFGNYVDYEYGNGQLTRIKGSDGRQIDLEYDGLPTVQRIKAHGRTWSYTYYAPWSVLGFGRFPALHTVTLPNTSKWTYVYGATGNGALNPMYTSVDADSGLCMPAEFDANSFVLTATSPSNATGVFEFPYSRMHRYGTPSNACVATSDGRQLRVADYFDVYALTRKTISGPGVAPLVWTYAYPGGTAGRINGYLQCGDACPSKEVIVTQPDLSKQVYRFGVTFLNNDGIQLGARTESASGGVLRTESSERLFVSLATPLPFPKEAGTASGSDDASSYQNHPLKAKTTVQDGVSFSWSVPANCATTGAFCYDQFARPIVELASNSTGYSKRTATEYHDDTAKWVLGQVKMRTDTTTGIVESRTDFNAASLPWKTFEFGLLKQTATYDPQGNLTSVSDPNDSTNFDTTVHLADWYRDVPRLVTLPPINGVSATRKATANAFGSVTSTTDENQFTTTYVYDDVKGDLLRTVYPAIGSTWTNTLFEARAVSEPEHGLGQGHWRHRSTTGNLRTTTYLDALWRPVVKEVVDLANEAGTRSVTVSRFDHDGQAVFQSYPQRSVTGFDLEYPGVKTFYDALGRQTSVSQSSAEQGPLITSTTYLPGMEQRVVDPELNATTTRFQLLGEPSYDRPIHIAHPMGVATFIQRDAYGKPTTLTRSGSGE